MQLKGKERERRGEEKGEEDDTFIYFINGVDTV